MRILGSLLLAAALAALPVAAGGPSGVFHDPPGAATQGKSVPLSVALEGIGNDRPAVLVHFRQEGAGAFQTLPLESDGPGRFSGKLPAAATRGLNLKYYIEISGSRGSYEARVGSAAQPMSIMLLEPAGHSNHDWLPRLGLVALSVALVAGVFHSHQQRKKNAVLDQLFWASTLGPLARLRGETVADHVTRLAAEPLDHPVHGMASFDREEIMRRLREVRILDKTKLARDRDRYVHDAKRFRIEVGKVSAQFVQDKLGPLASEVSRLAAAAWFLSSSQSNDGKPDLEFLDPFEEARLSVRGIQKAVEEKRFEEASLLLDELTRKSRKLRRLVSEFDFACSADRLARHIAEAVGVTADTLGRLLEYYALSCEKNPESRRKLLVVALSLAQHDGIDGDDPTRFRETLRRRKLLQSDDPERRDEKLPQQLVQNARQILAKIDAVRETAEPNLDPLKAEVETYCEQLGRQLYTANGLAEAAVLELALRTKAADIDRAKAGSLDSLVTDLNRVADDGESADWTAEDENQEAVVLLQATEVDLREGVADDSYRERGFYLEDIEIDAARGNADVDPDWTAMIVRCTACRTAADRFASAHARQNQPEGQEPPPLPLATARTLLRRAAQLERDLKDQIERDRMHGKREQADATERFLNRFSRTRIGLALLAKLPTKG